MGFQLPVYGSAEILHRSICMFQARHLLCLGVHVVERVESRASSCSHRKSPKQFELLPPESVGCAVDENLSCSVGV
ncbi:MAG: hypothetical protein IJU53_03880 [Thermoguttaceae bacterium]|nr:hypothetical protein [Thermoguttaceae bacterium]